MQKPIPDVLSTVGLGRCVLGVRAQWVPGDPQEPVDMSWCDDIVDEARVISEGLLDA